MISSYLIFLLSDRLFGVKLLGAIEILPWRKARHVPLSYSYVEGLVDYRRTVYPVFNLGQRLGLNRQASIGFTPEESDQAEKKQSIILLEENKFSFGIIVDSIVKMTKLEEPAAGPPQSKAQGIDLKYAKGFVYEEDQEIMILDFERLLHAG